MFSVFHVFSISSHFFLSHSCPEEFSRLLKNNEPEELLKNYDFAYEGQGSIEHVEVVPGQVAAAMDARSEDVQMSSNGQR